MEKNSFDLCTSNCEECNGINVASLGEADIYMCENTKKLLQKIDDRTLVDFK